MRRLTPYEPAPESLRMERSPRERLIWTAGITLALLFTALALLLLP